MVCCPRSRACVRACLPAQADNPAAEGTVTRTLPAKEQHIEVLRVRNWLQKPQRFKVCLGGVDASRASSAGSFSYRKKPHPTPLHRLHPFSCAQVIVERKAADVATQLDVPSHIEVPALCERDCKLAFYAFTAVRIARKGRHREGGLGRVGVPNPAFCLCSLSALLLRYVYEPVPATWR